VYEANRNSPRFILKCLKSFQSAQFLNRYPNYPKRLGVTVLFRLENVKENAAEALLRKMDGAIGIRPPVSERNRNSHWNNPYNPYDPFCLL
jgi:hypothetical protein